MKQLRMMDISGATVYRGILGYGFTGNTHKQGFLHLSHDLPVMVPPASLTAHDQPIVVTIIDSEEKIARLLPIVEEMMGTGLIAISDVAVSRIQKT